MISSAIPSAKYSCSGSLVRLVRGNTAIDGLSGRARGRTSIRAVVRVGDGIGMSAAADRRRRRVLPHLRQETHGFAYHCSNEQLRRTIVADRPPSGLDPTEYGGVGGGSPALHQLDWVVLADGTIAVAYQMDQEVEHLRLQPDRHAIAMQFPPLLVEYVAAKMKSN